MWVYRVWTRTLRNPTLLCMARYVTTIQTPLSTSEAFKRVADVARFAEWDPGVLEGKQVVGSSPGLGATYELLIDGVPKQVFRYEVQTFEPGEQFYMVARTPRFTSRDTIRVHRRGEHTFVTYEAELQANGAFGLLDPLLQRVFKRIGDRAAAGLATFLGGAIVS